MTKRIVGRASASWLAMVMLVSGAPLVSAVTPTLGVDKYPQSTLETFDWGTGATTSNRAWLRSAFQPAAETYFQASINNSKAPDFDFNTSSSNFVKFQARDDSDCASPIAWYACTLYDGGNGRWAQTIYASETVWCQETGNATGCRDVHRVALHELGHAVGLSRSADNGGNDAHSTESESYTVMRLNTPGYSASGWSTDYLQECDVIELQREYDVESYASDYANCIDELGGLTGGALTSVALLNTPSISCPDEIITLSGTLKLATNSTWGMFSGNPLTRTGTLQRKPGSGSVWSNVATISVASGNWSRVVTVSPGTWDFRFVFGGATRIAPDTSNTQRLVWGTPC